MAAERTRSGNSSLRLGPGDRSAGRDDQIGITAGVQRRLECKRRAASAHPARRTGHHGGNEIRHPCASPCGSRADGVCGRLSGEPLDGAAVSVAEAEVSPGGQETTADAEVDGLCAIVTFPGKPPVILTASDGAWAVVATSWHAYDPDERSCLGRRATGEPASHLCHICRECHARRGHKGRSGGPKRGRNLQVMAVTGINHIAIVTTDLERHTKFYGDVFGTTVSFRMEASDDHPRMWIYELGGGSSFNVFETTADQIVGDRGRQGGRVHSTTLGSGSTPEPASSRLRNASLPPAPTSATSRTSAATGRCSSETSMAWSSRSRRRSTPRCDDRGRCPWRDGVGRCR